MKKVMATGTFDLLHPGHGIYLNEAKKLGGEDAKLYVVIARDSTVEKRKRYPIVGEQQRLELIKMIKGVDLVALTIAPRILFTAALGRIWSRRVTVRMTPRGIPITVARMVEARTI